MIYFVRLFLITSIFTQFTLLFSQNLVNNPSFENFSKCPEEMGNITSDVFHWVVATKGTTDYFNTCSSSMGVPINFNGEQHANFGAGYAGLYLIAPNDYREYLQVQLTQKLERGKKYKVSFYVSLAEKSNLAIANFGVMFSEKRINEPTRFPLVKSNGKKRHNHFHYIEINAKSYLNNKAEWIKIENEFIANGSETFITLGNFSANSSTDYQKVEGQKPVAYYYLDMVVVEPSEIDLFDQPLEVSKVYVLNNVLFKTDDSQLDLKAKTQLNKLFGILKEDSSLTVKIDAHTDIDGSVAYNYGLSDRRALSVSTYLIEVGLDKNRITWYGHGGKKPVAENSSADGKQQNRRVEFTLLRSDGFELIKSDGISEIKF